MSVGDCETADSNAIDDVHLVEKFEVVSRGKVWASINESQLRASAH